jgi:hypothetical protein
VANAGANQSVATGAVVTLDGVVTGGISTPVIKWYLYSGPGSVAFAHPALAATTATFSAPGSYTLMLSATDGVHAVAYSAVIINVGVNADGSRMNGG